jgi:Ala-tRNA(Pro) deacylase
MPVPKKVLNFLEKNKTPYKIVEHRKAYTAFNKAESLKVKSDIVAKTLVMKADRDIILVSLPANKKLDEIKLKKAINKVRKKEGAKAVKKIAFASQKTLKDKFKGIKLGVVPPFGNLFGYPTFVNNSLLKKREIIVNSGDYKLSLKIKTSSLKKLIPDLVSATFSKSRK